MNLQLNLARRPAENRRRVWVVWGGLFAISFACFLVFLLASLADWNSTARVRRQITVLDHSLNPLRKQERELYGRLSRPSVKDEMQRSAYINSLIDQKAVSWTLLFERLEALLPQRVQLVELRPGRQRRESAVQITVAAPDVTDAIAFIRQLEGAHDFSDPQVLDVRHRSAQQGNGVLMSVRTSYHPPLASPTYWGQPQSAESGLAASPTLAANHFTQGSGSAANRRQP